MRSRPSIQPDDFRAPIWKALSSADDASALAAKRDTVARADLEQALSEFIPSAQGLEKELQELAAVLECTQRSFLPAEWQEKVAQAGRAIASCRSEWSQFGNCWKNSRSTSATTTIKSQNSISVTIAKGTADGSEYKSSLV